MNKLFFLILLALPWMASAQNHKGMTFQGYIKTPGGVPLNVAGVTVNLKVLSPNNCILLDEDHSGVNISNGYLILVLGKGTRTGWDEGYTFKQIFDNGTTRNGLDPATGPAGSCNYVPSVDRQDARKVRVYFMNGGDPIQADFNIRGAAFAVASEDSELLGGKASSEFIQTTTDVTQARTNALFAPEVYNNLLNVGTTNTGAFVLPVGTTGQQPGSPSVGMIRFNDTIDQVEFYNGTTWTTMSSGGGSVSSVTSANLYLTVATGTTTPSLTVNVGTAANTVAAGNDSRIVNAIQNAGFTPSIKTGAEGSQGAAGTLGQLYIASNSSKIYRDNGSSWDLLFPALTGDVSSSIGTVTTTVTKLRGVSIGTTAPVDLQVLKYDNGTTSWLANYMAITDLRSTVNPAANPLFSSYSCTANQTLTWNAPTGQLGCTNIASLDATAIGAGTISPARLGIGTADGTTFLRGDGTWASPGGGGSGDVVGPASATDNAIVRYDGTTGKLLQDSGVVIDDLGNVGIGTTSPSRRLNVVDTTTAITSQTGFEFSYTSNPSAAATFSSYIGLNSTATKSGPNIAAEVNGIAATGSGSEGTITRIYGIDGVALTSGTATTSRLSGGHFEALAESGTTATETFGVRASSADYNGTITNSHGGFFGDYLYGTRSSSHGVKSVVHRTYPSGTVTNVYGVHSSVRNDYTGNMTNAYGMYSTVDHDSGDAGSTNSYGVYVGLVEGASKWSIFTSDSTAPSYFSGNVGIGTINPRSGLDVNSTILGKPAVSNASSTIDFSTGNIQYTTANCGSFQLHNIKDGGSYTFIVQGTTAATCTFTGYSDSGVTALTMHMPPDNGATTASKHTIFNIIVGGTHAYVAWTPGY